MPARDDTLLFAHQVRMTQVQRDYLSLVAQSDDISLSHAIRQCIDRAIDSAPPIEGATVRRQGSDVEEPMTLRYLLEATERDPDELAEIIARASLHE
jgi:flavin-binding protein dodecin